MIITWINLCFRGGSYTSAFSWGSGAPKGLVCDIRTKEQQAYKVCNHNRSICRGDGPEYRPFHDLRSGPEAGRPREQVEHHWRACTQVLFLLKAELRFFHFSTIVTGWLIPSTVRTSQYNLAGTFHRRRSRLAKTGFFRQARELKIQRKNSGSALRHWNQHQNTEPHKTPCQKTFSCD
jgi:hypothetical protein